MNPEPTLPGECRVRFLGEWRSVLFSSRPFSPSFLSVASQYSQGFHMLKNTSPFCFLPIIAFPLCSPSQSSCKSMSCLHLETESTACSLHLLVFSFLPTSCRLSHPHHSPESALAKVGDGLHIVKSIALCPLTSGSTPHREPLTSWTSKRPPYPGLSPLGVCSLSFPFLTVLSFSA